MSTSTNQISAIAPYWDDELATWVFDDPRVGLAGEPFVAGVPAMIDELLRRQLAGRRDERALRRPFRLLFSADRFPDALMCELVREELGGAYYRLGSREGWLCPALFRYFDAPPARVYVRAEELGDDAPNAVLDHREASE